MKKKLLSVFLAGVMAVSLAACSRGSGQSDSTSDSSAAGQSSPEQTSSEEKHTEKGAQTELTVFAAASLTETLEEISGLYAEEEPGVKLVFNFDSSGTLKTQIQEGADCDLFLSAAQLQMDQIDASADASVNTEGLDLVLEGSRRDLLKNKVVLCAAADSKVPVESFDDMADKLKEGTILLGMGNSDVPVGQYTEKILEYYGLDEKELDERGLISYGSNVKEVVTQISEEAVTCGVIYGTDARAAGLTVTDEAGEEMCGQVIYPAAVMKNSSHPEEAQAFLDFLQTDACMKIFEEAGFSGAGQEA